jgi:hypothetical protein
LSSKDLKPAEIRILSKGLNFCPTPNKINEEQLSADLDKFARSLRIKEYFSAKERDCLVDESSDSEDDNEIPLPRFKKKSSWIPKPSKNTTLESFIDSDGIFLFGLIPSLKNFLRCFSRNFRL